MALAHLLADDAVDLAGMWANRSELFPEGLTDREGAPLEGLCSAFAMSAVYPLIDAEVPPDLLRAAATEMEEPIAKLEQLNLTTRQLTDATRCVAVQTFASPDSGAAEPVEAVVGLVRELIAASRNVQDLYAVSAVLEAIAAKMEIVIGIAAIETNELDLIVEGDEA